MNKKAKWIIILLIVFLIDYFREYYSFSDYNQSSLSIITPDSTNQPYHPSVIYIPQKWNGYAYWMGETPYPLGKNGAWQGLPPYRERWENPCIHVSNNGLQWITPPGLTNPIDDLSPEEISTKDYYSDIHLVFHQDTLECWYRISKHGQRQTNVYILRKYSTDGTHWSNREIMIDLQDTVASSTTGKMIISPSILKKEGRYRMWYVDDNSEQHHILYSSSSDGKRWEKRIICNLKGYNINPWHIDVQHIDSSYYLVIYDWKNLTLWKSKDGLDFTYIKVLLNPAPLPGAFYSSGLYRSSLLKDNLEYKLYFSAYDKKAQIGLMCGPSPEKLSIRSVSGRKENLLSFFIIYLRIKKHILIHCFNKNK